MANKEPKGIIIVVDWNYAHLQHVEQSEFLNKAMGVPRALDLVVYQRK